MGQSALLRTGSAMAECSHQKMADYFVTVIVPVYNAEQTIEACLESLLRQDYPRDRYEIVVIDNNSVDSTKDRIAKYDVICAVEDQIQTSYAARNRGIQSAKGEILAFTDSDCVADVSWLRAGIQPFVDSRIGAVGGRVLAHEPKTYIERYQDRRQEMSQDRLLDPVQLRNKTAKIITCNAFFRREIFEKVGLFKAQLVSGGDHDLSMRIQNETEFLLSYAADSIVYHKHRSTLGEFWKQYYKYGLGRLYLAAEFKPNAVEKCREYGYLRPLYWQLRRIAPRVTALVSHGLRYTLTRRPEAKQEMVDAFLDAVRMAAFYSGNLRSSIARGTPYFE